MDSNWDGLVWILLLVGPLLILQRRLHREIQSVFLLLTRRRDIALVLFSLLFFPGVVLHELSHFVMAKLLQIRTGKFSLTPQPMVDGRLQLGYVETSRTDLVRDALVGAAPILAGGAFVIYAGISRLELDGIWYALTSGVTEAVFDSVRKVQGKPDFWLWFYLLFVASSTMLPSASDRRAWRPLVLIFAILIIISLAAGAGPWLTLNLMPHINTGMQVLAIILGISLSVHLILLFPLWGLRWSLSRITKMKVEF